MPDSESLACQARRQSFVMTAYALQGDIGDQAFSQRIEKNTASVENEEQVTGHPGKGWNHKHSNVRCRPWEAPEQMLADAGVELGVTYPYPVISLEESEEHLQIAAKVIQETLAASIAASEVRLRSMGKESACAMRNIAFRCDLQIGLHFVPTSAFGKPTDLHVSIKQSSP